MDTLTKSQHVTPERETTFNRVVVGIDGSPESLEAVRQAGQLAAPGAALTLFSAWHLAPPIVTSGLAPTVYDADERAAREQAENSLRLAAEELPDAATCLVRGHPTDALLDEIESSQCDLVAVGSHGTGRMAGILLGSTATGLIHRAPCSVLLARAGRGGAPTRIGVGVDGSPQSRTAYEAASSLAARFGSELVVVVAEGEKPVDLPGVSLIVGDGYHVIPEDPVSALRAASADVDLLVLGSRHLHGLKSLGSVSERVAHRAECSILLVRSN